MHSADGGPRPGWTIFTQGFRASCQQINGADGGLCRSGRRFVRPVGTSGASSLPRCVSLCFSLSGHFGRGSVFSFFLLSGRKKVKRILSEPG